MIHLRRAVWLFNFGVWRIAGDCGEALFAYSRRRLDDLLDASLDR